MRITLIFLLSLIVGYCNAQSNGKHPIFKDSIYTKGDSSYLVLVGSAWHVYILQHDPRRNYYEPMPYSDEYIVNYPHYYSNQEVYIKQTYNFKNGVIIKKSTVMPFPTGGDPSDTLPVKTNRPPIKSIFKAKT